MTMKARILTAIGAVVFATTLVTNGCESSPTPRGGPDTEKLTTVVHMVNAGSFEDYTDERGRTWSRDYRYDEQRGWGAIGGDTVKRRSREIADTPAPQIYLTERFGMESYRFDVANGKYDLRLHFAETYEGIQAADERQFKVTVNGQEAFAKVDPYADAGGFAMPSVVDYGPFEVTDGKIVIGFEPIIQSPEINGIEVVAYPQ